MQLRPEKEPGTDHLKFFLFIMKKTAAFRNRITKHAELSNTHQFKTYSPLYKYFSWANIPRHHFSLGGLLKSAGVVSSDTIFCWVVIWLAHYGENAKRWEIPTDLLLMFWNCMIGTIGPAHNIFSLTWCWFEKKIRKNSHGIVSAIRTSNGDICRYLAS